MTHRPDIRPLTLFADKPVYVVGLGASGMAAAHGLRAGGAKVLCWDDNQATRDTATAQGFNIDDPATSSRLEEAAALVLAPGIPLTHPAPHPAVLAAQTAGIEILGDIELLFRAQPKARYVGITGTNGKSTTTALVGHILRQGGVDVAIGGNLGIPALTLPNAAVYVLEMSSYQLELTPSAMFDIAVLLNITPDHLDRHGDLNGYIQAKMRILRPRDADSLAIIGIDEPHSGSIADQLMKDGRAISRIAHTTQPVADMIDDGQCPALAGDHGKQNAAAAFAIAQALGLSQESILEGLRSFPGLAHRQERIATLDGVTFINDSKATNAESAARALSAFDGIYWIAGGKGKDGGYGALDAYLTRVRHAFLIGDAAATMADWIGNRVPTTLSGTLETAIGAAFQMARTEPSAGPVILSPACASFDQFKNFEVRGDAFRYLVLALPANSRTVFSTREAA